MQAIKNIIFDLGGVFLNIDYKKTADAFIKLGVTNFDQLYTQQTANELFEELETGKIEPVPFYEAIRKATGLPLTDNDIKLAWSAMLLDFPADRIEWLTNIAKKYRVFLYSNTNAIHYDQFMEAFSGQNGERSFNDYFIKAYYSHEFGLRKPYPESYKALLDAEELNAAETLFIDDTLKNIEGAKAAGLHTIHLVPPATVLGLNL